MTATEQQQQLSPPSGEEVLVLYGTQTGNSESAAEEIENLLPFHLLYPTPCRARCMQLDDFLELEKARWTRLVIIVCSSYGVGQAPLGAWKFRELCDAILERRDSNGDGGGNDNDENNKFLKGVSFALLGLGDSHYTTFFDNPTAIHDALTAAGATRVGELGKADASGRGDMEQPKVIERWIEGIWGDLAKVTESSPDDAMLDEAREKTWGLCLELFPDWNKKSSAMTLVVLCLSLGGVMLSILVHFFLKNKEMI